VNPQINPTAQGVDAVLIYIFGVSLLLLVGITVATIYFVIKYRRSKCPEPTSDAHSSFWLEAVWTLLPTLIVLTMFWYGWTNYIGLREVPAGALEVQAVGRMWSWQFHYQNGRTSGKLYVPAGQPVKVSITSKDVIHSFFMPAFRIKRDAVPGMESYVWFQAPEVGSYDIFCAEYCGTGHADMITTTEVMAPDDFTNWLNDTTAGKVPRGRLLLEEHGCLGCHSLDGQAGIGPSLRNLQDHEATISLDPDHLARAIRNPSIEVAPGYEPIMPAFGEDQINEADLQAIIDYLQTAQDDPGTAQPDPRELLENNGCLGCHSTDGSPRVGPSFKGLKGRTIEVRRGDKKVQITIDAEYLRRAIKDPSYEIVEDYPAIMPKNDHLSDAEVEAIVNELLQEGSK
jgi:cytochrome c oxidase subunit 2